MHIKTNNKLARVIGIAVMSLHLLFDRFFVHYGTYYDKKMYFQSVWETHQK